MSIFSDQVWRLEIHNKSLHWPLLAESRHHRPPCSNTPPLPKFAHAKIWLGAAVSVAASRD